MTRSHTYHGSGVAWSPERLAFAHLDFDHLSSLSAVLQRLNDLGLGKVDLTLPASQTAPSIPITSWTMDRLDAATALRNWANTQFVSGDAFMSAARDASPSAQRKPRKRHPAAAIKRIEATTGKVVTGVTVGDDGRVSYTFAEASAAENPSEADEALEQWRKKKNAR